MARIAYVNGRYVRLADAAVHVEDRGYQFADGVYEVVGIHRGKMLDEIAHLDRLDRSLAALEIAQPMGRAALRSVMRETVRRNGITQGILYMQVTRGAVRRDHAIPKASPRPSVILTARRISKKAVEDRRTAGVRVITRPDERWARRDIKSTSLLANILAKTAARDAGAFEAWLIEGDHVTEGSSTTAWIVDAEGRLVTRDLSNAVLPGVTRRVIMEAAAEAQMPVVERRFTLAEALAAKEAFITAATLGATPVVEIDGKPVGEGKPGAIGRRVQELYAREAARKAAGKEA